jgi:hypothetical protein
MREWARQVLRKVLLFVGIKGFDAVERGKDLLLKPISLFVNGVDGLRRNCSEAPPPSLLGRKNAPPVEAPSQTLLRVSHLPNP